MDLLTKLIIPVLLLVANMAEAWLRFWSSFFVLFFKRKGSSAFNPSPFSAGSDDASAKFCTTVKGLFMHKLNFIGYVWDQYNANIWKKYLVTFLTVLQDRQREKINAVFPVDLSTGFALGHSCI